MTMGEYIRKLRSEKGWSQDYLGKLVGVNRAAVNKWEQGTVENIKRSTIKKLSQVFQVSPCDLMRWDDDNDTTKVDTCSLFEQCHEKEIFKTISLLLKLDEVDQAKILGRIEGMLEGEKYSTKEESFEKTAI